MLLEIGHGRKTSLLCLTHSHCFMYSSRLLVSNFKYARTIYKKTVVKFPKCLFLLNKLTENFLTIFPGLTCQGSFIGLIQK